MRCACDMGHVNVVAFLSATPGLDMGMWPLPFTGGLWRLQRARLVATAAAREFLLCVRERAGWWIWPQLDPVRLVPVHIERFS